MSNYISAIEKHLNRKAKIILEEMQPGDVEATYANNESLEDWIGYKPSTTIDEGVKNFIDWYLDYYKKGAYKLYKNKLPNLNNCNVGVIGLGYVGLPLALKIANQKTCLKTQKKNLIEK